MPGRSNREGQQLDSSIDRIAVSKVKYFTVILAGWLQAAAFFGRVNERA
jgi:hypothetical protein